MRQGRPWASTSSASSVSRAWRTVSAAGAESKTGVNRFKRKEVAGERAVAGVRWRRAARILVKDTWRSLEIIVDDYLKKSALDSFLKMERMRRSLSPLYDDLRSPIERLTQPARDLVEAWKGTSRHLDMAMRSAGPSLSESLALQASTLKAVERMNREMIIEAQRSVDSMRLYARDVSASFAEIATSYRDAFTRIEQVQRSIARSAYQEDYGDAIREALAMQSAWVRKSVLAPQRDFYRMAEEAGRLLRDTMASLSAVDLVPSEWTDEEDRESRQQIEQARERISASFSSPNPQNVLRALSEFLDESKSKRTKYTSIALSLLLNVVGGLLTAFMLQVMPLRTASQSSVVVVKEVKREAARIRKEGVAFPPEARVAIAAVLIVRSEPTRRSHAVGRLYSGDIVSVIKVRNRSWSLVEFSDQDEEIVVRGWVFSRYIVPLHGSRLHPRRRRRHLTTEQPVPATVLEDLVGCTDYRGPARSLEEMQEAIARGARERR